MLRDAEDYQCQVGSLGDPKAIDKPSVQTGEVDSLPEAR
jgi:hypothetical protein